MRVEKLSGWRKSSFVGAVRPGSDPGPKAPSLPGTGPSAVPGARLASGSVSVRVNRRAVLAALLLAGTATAAAPVLPDVAGLHALWGDAASVVPR